MNKKLENRRATSNNNPSSSNANAPTYATTKNTSNVNNSSTQNQQDNTNPGGNRSGGSPAHSLSTIQKIGARLRARNPVIMSMNTSPQMLLPLSQRGISPSSYQQLQTTQGHHELRTIVPGGGGQTSNSSQQVPGFNKNQQIKLQNVSGAAGREYSHSRKIMHKSLNNSQGGGVGGPPGSVNVNKMGQSIDQHHHQTLTSETQRQGHHAGKSADPVGRNQHISLNLINSQRLGNAGQGGPSGQGGSSGISGKQRSINKMHPNNNTNHHSLDNNRGGKMTTAYHHNINPVQHQQAQHRSSNHHSLQMQVGISSDHRRTLGSSVTNSINQTGVHGHGGHHSNHHGGGSVGDQQAHSVHLSKKLSGHRKRNAREKSYDLYNQKLQLPPMLKPGHQGSETAPGQIPQIISPVSSAQNGNGSGAQTLRGIGGKNERTYSLPSAGGLVNNHNQVGNHHNQQSKPLSPSMQQMQHHSLNANPNKLQQSSANNGASSSQNQQAQGQAGVSHSQERSMGGGSGGIPPRQSINEGLKSQVGQGGPNTGQNRFAFSGAQLTNSASFNNHAHHQHGGSVHPNSTKASKVSVNQNSGNSANMHSIKGFFSARGQGLRGTGQATPTSGLQASHDPKQQQAAAPSLQGMFSPRRQILNGTHPNQAQQAFGVAAQQARNQQRQPSSNKNGGKVGKGANGVSNSVGQIGGSSNNASSQNYVARSLHQPSHQQMHQQQNEKEGRDGVGGHQANLTTSQSRQEEMRIRQSMTVSPRPGAHQTRQTPNKVTLNSSHHQSAEQARNNSMGSNDNMANKTTGSSSNQGGQQSSSIQSSGERSTGQGDQGKQEKDSPAQPRGASALSENPEGDSNIQFVEVQTLLFGENPPVLNPKTLFLKNHEPTKASQKKCGHIKSYAANTNQGIIRDYNEDRVSIILNILKPNSKRHLNIDWPQICFFGVFDGHGGAACADYLRDNLHNFVVQNENFPQQPEEAITAGFRECERQFINLVEAAQSRAQHANPTQNVGPERSGSCATVVMIIDDQAYVINVGDSRCIMSLDAGANIGVLSRDHKPDDDKERVRIQAAGGKIYRTQTFAKAAASPDERDLYVQGPLRVFPGRLSVSRTFGDIEAKKHVYGGNPNVIVCEPEIKTFKLKNNFDFFLIGCDGIFERLDNKQTIESVWNRISEQTTNRAYDNLSPKNVSQRNQQKKMGANTQQRSNNFFYDEHIAAAEGVEIALREAAASRSLDNITVLILGLKNLKTTIKKLNAGQNLSSIRQQNVQDQKGVKNTYDQDFEELEVNEADLNILSENDVNSANDSMEADQTVTVENERKRAKHLESPGKHDSSSSPSKNASSKVPAQTAQRSNKQQMSTSVSQMPRKF